jgi:acetylornithine deacetylase/succinyl-diaminopimelate desuccinylase-like protein
MKVIGASLLVFYCYLLPLFAAGGENPLQKNESSKLQEAITFLSDYLKIDSETGNERPSGEFLAAYCASSGLEVEVFSDDVNKYNFSASIFPLILRKPNVILLNHIDVVPAGHDHGWKNPPYSGNVDEEMIWGRGAVDCKGLAAMQLMAMLAFKEEVGQTDLPFNITMLSVSNEETGGNLGAKWVLDNYRTYLNPVLVLGEGGSGLQDVLQSDPHRNVYAVSVAEKSNLWLQLELEQESNGHAATPGITYANKTIVEGLNRINQRKLKPVFNPASKLMFRELGMIEGGLRGFVLRHINWDIFAPMVRKYFKKDPLYNALVTNSITITNIQNPPGPPNTVSSRALVTLDCRLLPGTDPPQFIRKLRKLIDEPDIKINVLNQGPDPAVTLPGFYFYQLKRAIKAFDEEAEVVPILFPASTDNSYFRAAGIPTYGIMPSVLSREILRGVHGVNERLPVEALNSGIIIFHNFLQFLAETYPKKGLSGLETRN